ncbi:hypothetical protein HPB49_014029 [Dermacentor silvarum]|uniref:Uncharacterized protein n=1 Tax=Dermacentor silvarum TaxID=543639 RepID=A0ACB8C406_DERSI|nr:hypothetical protein HPB49_014029 [Dermacentor silvarum]
MRRRFQRCRDTALRAVHKASYCAALAKFRRSIEREKDYAAKEKCTACSKRSLFAEPFKVAFDKANTRTVLPPLRLPDGGLTEGVLQSAQLLLDTLIARDNEALDEPCHMNIRQRLQQPYRTAFADCDFTKGEIDAVLSKMTTSSAPGLDGLTTDIVSAICRAHPRFILMIFNAALALGHFPNVWRQSRVIFIRKPGRPLELPSAYRPICMSSILGKVLERLLHGRLYHFLVARGLIHPLQYGFTHGKSSVMALQELCSFIRMHRSRNTPVTLISLDFQGAFGSVYAWYFNTLGSADVRTTWCACCTRS